MFSATKLWLQILVIIRGLCGSVGRDQEPILYHILEKKFQWTRQIHDMIIVGADGEDVYKGAAYVFRNHVVMFELETDLRAASADPKDKFGGSVSIFGKETTIDCLETGTDHEDLTDHEV